MAEKAITADRRHAAAGGLVEAALREDAGAWWETRGKIANKANEVVTPVMNFLQNRVLAVVVRCSAIGLPVRVILLKPRQKGSTTFSAALMYHALRRKRTAACIIGGQYSQTRKAWAMMQTYLKNDATKWGNTGEINEEQGRFSHGSTLEPETAKDYDAGRSGTVQFLLATEVARWASEGVADAKTVLAGILKCVPLLPETTVVLESTAKGASGDFYTRWSAAVPAEEFLAGRAVGPGQYVAVFAPWFEFEDSALRLTAEQKREVEATLDAEEWYRGERELLENFGQKEAATGRVTRLGGSVTGSDVWEQLAWRRWAIAEECSKDVEVFNEDYPESAEKAFLRSGRMRFNAAGVRAMGRRAELKAVMHGVLDPVPGDGRSAWHIWRDVAKNEATMWCWEKPMNGRKYLVTVDPMTGATQTGGKDPDCHAVLVLRSGYFEAGRGWTRPAVVARVAPPCRWDVDVLEEAVWRLACWYGGTRPVTVVPEVNMDRGLIELMKLRGAGNIYGRKLFNRREGKETDALGWQTTTATRETAIELVARAVREWDREGEGVDVWCPHVLAEMGKFTVKESGRSEAEAGAHDDDVLALGIGLATLGSAVTRHEARFLRAMPAEIAEGLARERAGALRRGEGEAQYA